MVRQQAEVGVDVVSDGEFGKGISWSQYVIERVSRLRAAAVQPGDRQSVHQGADRERFAEFYEELDAKDHVETITEAVAVGADQIHRAGAAAGATSTTSRRR